VNVVEYMEKMVVPSSRNSIRDKLKLGNLPSCWKGSILDKACRLRPDLMHSFDIFVLSSLWEGLPRVLPQAMAAGLPIVATVVDGNAEAVTDGVNGFLTPPGDPQAMAAALMRLLEDPALARKMGKAGRIRAEEFSARKMVSDIAALYEALLAEHVFR
jgi:glycosyltransferase involved in cell wall biosynthesis